MKSLLLNLNYVYAVLVTLFVTASLDAADPLPSWNETGTKRAIIGFVERVTDRQSSDYVKPEARIATFDNDGTLWSEQPYYFQIAFAFDRVKAMASKHPEWSKKQPFKGVLEGDLKAVMAGGKESLLKLIATTHSGMTSEEFEQEVTDWISKAKHPKTGRLYKEMVFQPMLELLTYLRANGFKTYIVSGGGIEFMRPWTEAVYGIPPEQVVGSRIKTQYEIRDGQPVIVSLPEVNFIDDKEGKPIGIHYHIGRRPIFAAGNSDGDWQMLQYTTIGRSPSFGLIVHHTDAEREWAYDRNSHIGQLDKALADAPQQGWTVIDMKKDWIRIYPEK
ncbi:HAD family hydrolase [Thalassoroseus pseudoceratinae]|uniref:HAD family hydrolase n=1 Tax=Thalassoroseus pseudoceratinae TaxID=2713176 RepID=UPI0014238B46|nr:HAD family hydrolase [Thalassoroseus pseudoceratinae]